MRDFPPTNPAFVYRAGIRMAGTVVTCDGSAASDLVFLSHAPVLSAHRRGGLPRLGSGRRRQLLATEATLMLLGPVGARLRPHALIAAFGRPFALGDLRLELFPSDHLPGAASLLCEQGGRRFLYAGPIGDGAELRTADAVCVDARWAAADLQLPDRAAARTALVEAARERGAGGAPVLLVDPPALAPVIAQALAEAGLATRTHRKILEAFGVYRQALGAARPTAVVQRFSGRLTPSELLLWPAGAPVPAQAMKSAPRATLLVGPHAARESARGRLGAAAGIAFPFGADAARLIRYVAATGASQVALVGAPDDHLANILAERGVSAYRLGPPRQMPLFG
jgi:hypothetical protein